MRLSFKRNYVNVFLLLVYCFSVVFVYSALPIDDTAIHDCHIYVM